MGEMPRESFTASLGPQPPRTQGVTGQRRASQTQQTRYLYTHVHRSTDHIGLVCVTGERTVRCGASAQWDAIPLEKGGKLWHLPRRG